MSSSNFKVTVIGSGNWGTAVAKIAGENIKKYPDLFNPSLKMWVYEEIIEGEKLSSIINSTHENIKYLPGVKLPDNIVAVPDIVAAAEEADILIFNFPHQFAERICSQLKGHVKSSARGISCIKGVMVTADEIKPFPTYITNQLGIYCGALSGANIASEVALEEFSETTIAYLPPDFQGHKNDVSQEIIRKLFHRRYFHVQISDDVVGVCLCGALKNVVALAAGIVDGLGWGNNSKSAIIRRGVNEMAKFGMTFFEGTTDETYTKESCGVADVITSCYGGRNRKCAEQFVKARTKTIDEIEAEFLNGQKIQGAATSAEVHEFLKARGKSEEFKLFELVYEIIYEGRDPENIINYYPKES